MSKLVKALVLTVILCFSFSSFAFSASEDVFIGDTSIDTSVLNENIDINPDAVVNGTSEAILEAMESIKGQPSNQDLYKKVGELCSKNGEKGYKVFADGSLIDFSNYDNVQPAPVGGRTMIPVRAMAESLGANVEWDAATKLITITLSGKEIRLTLNSKTAYINGKESALDAPAASIGGRTMIPLRFVGEAFGKNVGWYPSEKINVISISD